MDRARPAYNAASMSTAAEHDRRPLIALSVGDVAGIGPEIVGATEYGGGTVSAMISGHEVAQHILKGWLHQAKGTQHV